MIPFTSSYCKNGFWISRITCLLFIVFCYGTDIPWFKKKVPYLIDDLFSLLLLLFVCMCTGEFNIPVSEKDSLSSCMMSIIIKGRIQSVDWTGGLD